MSSSPRYRQIAEDLRRRIAEGEFPVGTALPGISALQDEYEVAGLNTVRQAQAVLIEEGLIVAEQGRGTYVIAIPAPAGKLEAVREAVDELRASLESAQAALARITRQLGPEPA